MSLSSIKIFVKIFCLILICGFATAGAAAQGKQGKQTSRTKPDFSGTWLLDRKKSNVGSPAIPDKPLKIVHHDPEFQITRTIASNGPKPGQDLVYYTDGRGETNPTTMFLATATDMNPPGDKDLTKSKTTWSGDKLVTRFALRSLIGGRQLEFEIIDEWKLSKDGQTLTQTSRTVFRQDMSGGVFVPANRPDTKRVYNRVPD